MYGAMSIMSEFCLEKRPLLSAPHYIESKTTPSAGGLGLPSLGSYYHCIALQVVIFDQLFIGCFSKSFVHLYYVEVYVHSRCGKSV